MIQRATVAIDRKKSEDFVKFMKSNAKNEEFWKDVKKTASSEIASEELEELFKNI